MKHPLYNKVQQIVAKKAVSGTVKHSDFSHIRNQASVRAILTSMGYEPNCKTRPLIWSIPKTKKQPELEIKDGFGNGLSVGEKIKQDLLDGQTIFIDDVLLSRGYFLNIIGELKAKGMNIIKTTCKGSTRALSYRVDTQ